MNFFRRNKPIEDVEETSSTPEAMEASTADEYLKRGLSYHANGKYEEAEADLREAIALNGDSVDAHYNLGLVYKAMGRNEDAAEAFKTAEQKLPILEEEDPVRALLVGKILAWQIRQATA